MDLHVVLVYVCVCARAHTGRCNLQRNLSCASGWAHSLFFFFVGSGVLVFFVHGNSWQHYYHKLPHSLLHLLSSPHTRAPPSGGAVSRKSDNERQRASDRHHRPPNGARLVDELLNVTAWLQIERGRREPLAECDTEVSS